MFANYINRKTGDRWLIWLLPLYRANKAFTSSLHAKAFQKTSEWHISGKCIKNTHISTLKYLDHGMDLYHPWIKNIHSSFIILFISILYLIWVYIGPKFLWQPPPETPLWLESPSTSSMQTTSVLSESGLAPLSLKKKTFLKSNGLYTISTSWYMSHIILRDYKYI